MKAYTSANGAIWFEQELQVYDAETMEHWEQRFPAYAALVKAENAYKAAWNDMLAGSGPDEEAWKLISKTSREAHAAFMVDALADRL